MFLTVTQWIWGEATGCRPIWIAALDRTFLEVHDWQQYTEMLSQWARSIDTFETTVKRISELPELVYFEIEERHVRNQRAHVVNSMMVFEFDAEAKIRHLTVYLQQAGRKFRSS